MRLAEHGCQLKQMRLRLFVFKGLSRFKSKIVNCIFFIVSVIFLRPSPALASSASQSSVPKLKTKTRDSRDPSVRFCM